MEAELDWIPDVDYVVLNDTTVHSFFFVSFHCLESPSSNPIKIAIALDELDLDYT